MNKDDYDIAVSIVVKQAQSEGIKEEQIRSWDLYLDDARKIGRMKSRLEQPELSNEGESPIHISNRNHITELIIRHKREELYHAGVVHTLCELIQKFWIPKDTKRKIYNQTS